MAVIRNETHPVHTGEDVVLVRQRVRDWGDLWAPLLAAKGRFELEKYL